MGSALGSWCERGDGGMTLSMRPDVSVVLGVFNEAEFIQQTLDSVFAQSVEILECIVVDDASTDDTVALLRAYAESEPRVHLLIQEEHRGLTHALRRGVEEARGTWMARIDARDTWAPEKLAGQLAYAAEHPEVGLIGCAAEESNQQTGQISIRRKPEMHEDILAALWRDCPFIHPTILARLDLVRACGSYDPAYGCSQDYDLYWRLLFTTEGHNLPEVLAYRPTHGVDSISLSRWKEQVRCTLRIRWRNYRKHRVALYHYRHLLPLLFKLLLPGSLKLLKQRIVRKES
jgi:glycosyltransferase involved in cell wall biosynthesis